MEALWAQDNSAMDIEPSHKSISVGWDAVKKNFESEFNTFSELKVTQADGPHIQVKGDVAWSTGIANSTLKTKAGAVANGPVFETDVFEKRGATGCSYHTALRVPQ
jgi:ketosteroid isomerase-like protein